MTQEQIIYLPFAMILAAVQVRREFSEESLQGLKESLLAVGQLVPIRVRKEGDFYVIVDGERRFRAMQLAGTFETIAAIVEQQDLAPAAVCHRQLVANVQREGLSPLECSNALRELMGATGWSVRETATKVGISAASVAKLLTLTQLPPEILAHIESGRIPASAGYDLNRIADPAEQARLAEQLAQGQLTRDGLTGIVKSTGTGQKQTTGAKAARFKVELTGGRSVTLAGAGLDSLETLIAWLEELLGKARKLRPKGLELATFGRILADEAKA